mgnify:CR=1 FL=1
MVKQIKEIGIPVLIWLFFIPQSISGGFDFAELEIEPSEGIPIQFRIIILTASFIMSFSITLVNYLRPKMSIENYLEKILTEESYKIICKRAKFFLVGSAFFGLFGISGLIKCNSLNSPAINEHILQVPLILGTGIFCGGVVSYLIKRFSLKKMK